jgi:hypothetical protein
MKTIFACAAASILVIGGGGADSSYASDAACRITDFKTKMYKEACAKSGEKGAKDAAKAFMKQSKIKSCNQCHAKLAPAYELKADALDQFRKAGGK